MPSRGKLKGKKAPKVRIMISQNQRRTKGDQNLGPSQSLNNSWQIGNSDQISNTLAQGWSKEQERRSARHTVSNPEISPLSFYSTTQLPVLNALPSHNSIVAGETMHDTAKTSSELQGQVEPESDSRRTLLWDSGRKYNGLYASTFRVLCER